MGEVALLRVIIGGVPYPTIEGGSVTYSRAATDPVPTCSVLLRDNASTLNPQCYQELLILDDQQIPNPCANLLPNPSLNPYNSPWHYTNPVTGITASQNTGGGVTFTFSNAANNAFQELYITLPAGSVAPGVTYTLSYYVQGSSAVNISTGMQMEFQDAAQNNLSGGSSPHVAATGTNTRYSLTLTAPATAAIVFVDFFAIATSTTNSGSVTISQLQLEPQWIPTQSYPTPWCGPNQTNCQQLPLGQWIRQYRKFAGLVTRVWPQNYHGNVRTIQIDASGYAWLMSTIIVNDSFTSQTDSAIISSLLSKYLQAPQGYYQASNAAMLTTTNVVTGVTLSNFGSNWDDLRTLFDGLAGLTTFYWTIDAYWNFIYAPPGYITMPISLICDNSSQPDMVLTFPAYNFSAETDATQPGSTILVLGSGSNVAEVIDPNVPALIGALSGYTLPTGTSWMRKINDSTLQSTTDATNRGLAELAVFDSPRNLYHLTTNVELIPGEAIAITSATEGLTRSTQLVQQTTATWLGTDETLKDVWEYQSDLGAVNRNVIHMLSRIYRLTQQNTSAPAIAVTTLAASEQPLGIVESLSTGTATTYFAAIQVDAPSAVYALGELVGTVADDTSGNANPGTISGGVTLGAATLLTDAADSGTTAMTFNGSSGVITLPTTFIPTGAHAWSLEIWCKVNSLPAASGFATMLVMGQDASGKRGSLLIFNNAGTSNFYVDCFGSSVASSTVVATSTIYHVVGTYDGTAARIYVNGSLVGGPTSFALNLAAVYASIGADSNAGTQFFNGTLQYAAVYTVALSAGQVSAHYNAGI